jgi:hypothetical protein
MIILLIMAIIEWIGPMWLYDNTTREPWPRIFMNILLTGLWIGTIPASFYTCGDLCSAAGPNAGDIKFATFYCQCYNSQSGYQRLALRGGTEQRTGRYEATEGLDILLAYDPKLPFVIAISNPTFQNRLPLLYSTFAGFSPG